MPYKAKKPCKYPNCPNLTYKNYCDYHYEQWKKERERYRKANGRDGNQDAKKLKGKAATEYYKQHRTDPDHDKRYGADWQILRAKYIGLHPFCERCLAKGVAVRAQEVHHVKPLRDGGSNDFENLMSLCRKCHKQMHEELEYKRRRGE